MIMCVSVSSVKVIILIQSCITKIINSTLQVKQDKLFTQVMYIYNVQRVIDSNLRTILVTS